MAAPLSARIQNQGSPRASLRTSNRLLRFVLVLLMLPITAAGLVVTAAPANAVGAVASVIEPSNGFPIWYEDADGNRVEQCLDATDPNCPLLAAPGFDPAQPISFPTNFPPEMFYAMAESVINTNGCAASGIAPGRIRLRLAVEAAFLGGAPSPTDRMVFGRTRIQGTGLCPSTAYTFQQPFGTLVLNTNDLGTVTAVEGTTDVGCTPAPGVPCDFSLATKSQVFGVAGSGFLKWDTGAPAGYLGDNVTPHTITGGTNGNAFVIQDPTGENALSNNLFVVAGKSAGSLVAPTTDYGSVTLGTTSAAKTVTVTNVDKGDVLLGATSFAGSNPGQFGLAAGGTCFPGRSLIRDESCTYKVEFSPTGASAGSRSATLVVASTQGVRSPLSANLIGFAADAGATGGISLSTSTMAFPNTRVRETSAAKQVIITNNGSAAVSVSKVEFDPTTFPEYDHYAILQETCTQAFIPPSGTCLVSVEFAPTLPGAHPTSLVITSNAPSGTDAVTVTGTGTGGLAAVSDVIDPNTGFPTWYMDEAGYKLAECIDPADPNCIVLADPTYDPTQPLAFPTNFPGEFFYHVATSDNLTINDPECATDSGKAFMRSAIEAAFANGDPVAGDQMTFGRIRFFISGALCPDSEYELVSPYGADHFFTDGAGGLRRKDATNDVGCVPAAGVTCDWSLALSSRVLGGAVRWDPAVSPAAPAGYLGDGANLHAITGAPFAPDGVHPANYFEIRRVDTDEVIGHTDLFAVMGKMQGPLEAKPTSVDFGAVAQASTSGTRTVTLSNTGIAPLTIDSAVPTGVDATSFTITGGTCVGITLQPGDTCTVNTQFSPTASGELNGAIRFTHSGLNNPFDVPLTGVGAAVGATANISFTPATIAFGKVHVARPSELERVRVSNAGGQLPLSIDTITLGGVAGTDYTIVKTTCPTTAGPITGTVPIDGSCTIDVAFSPVAGGDRPGTIVITDNAPGGTHTVALTGTGITANENVSTIIDSRNGFPTWYQDDNGNRVEPCLDATTGYCVLLGDAGYNPANPISFPSNFPTEFFYALADSELVTTPGCPAAGVAPGTMFLRLALEGSFANGTPIAGDQIMFGRVRITGDGLCPNVPYTFVTPYGEVTWSTDNTGAIKRNAATTNVGTGVPGDALAAPMFDGFPRWNPNIAPLAPAGHLGDAVTFHEITGGTYVLPGTTGAFNGFQIKDSADNVLGTTKKFLVSGRIAGPLQASTYSLALGSTNLGTPSAAQSVTIYNVGAQNSITSVTKGGLNADQFEITGNTCAAAPPMATDATCQVTVRLNATTAGTKSALITVTPGTGAPVTISVTGTANVVGAPKIAVGSGALTFGTRNVGTSTTVTTSISNTGTADLVISAENFTGTAAGDYSIVPAAANACAVAMPITLTPGASCTLAVAFSPKANGARTATLTLVHNAAGNSTAISLSGTGVASSISVGAVKFGTVGLNTTKTQTVTVKNTSTISVRIQSASYTGAQAAFFGVTNNGTCINQVLAAGKSCSFTISFRPTQAINYSATLNVRGDATMVPNPALATVSGTGK